MLSPFTRRNKYELTGTMHDLRVPYTARDDAYASIAERDNTFFVLFF